MPIQRYWTSDTHFGHKRIIELCNRPFADTSEMDEIMIANWNSVVGPSDTVMHLGDAVMGNLEAGMLKMKRLNGSIVLVPGNHDRVFSGTVKKYKQEKFLPLYKEVFEEIMPESNVMRVGPHLVNVSHFPYDGDSHGENRWMDKRMQDDGKVIVHGHVHEEFVTRGRQLNVGVDVWEFMPVHEDQVVTIIGELMAEAELKA